MTQGPGKPPDKYQQIADGLRAQIEAGEFPVGAQLPSIETLQSAYGAAKGTIDHALAVLRELGLVETRHGSGSFVLRELPDEPEADKLAGQVAELQKELAELRQRTGRIEARLATLAGQSRGGRREQENTAASDGRQ